MQQDPKKPLTEKEIALNGFHTQCDYVHPHLMKVIDEVISQNENIVIEGVHLTVNFLMTVMKKYPFCIPFVVIIKNKEKHKERFAVRSKHMTLDPKYNKYVECFPTIRIIHKSFVRKAEKNLIPRIDNTNVDKSLGLIHSTIVRCLRKIVKGEPLIDDTTGKATILTQEFNAVSKSGLSSAEAQKIIKSKVNKGEIFKRFFGEQDEPQMMDVGGAEEETPQRVRSFDENEMEEMRKEKETAAEKEKEANEASKEQAKLANPHSPVEHAQKDHQENGISKMETNKIELINQANNKNQIPTTEAKEDKKEEAKNEPVSQSPEEEVKVIKTSKSSENLMEEAKKKKKKVRSGRIGRGRLIERRFRQTSQEDPSPLEEDKQVSIFLLINYFFRT